MPFLAPKGLTDHLLESMAEYRKSDNRNNGLSHTWPKVKRGQVEKLANPGLLPTRCLGNTLRKWELSPTFRFGNTQPVDISIWFFLAGAKFDHLAFRFPRWSDSNLALSLPERRL